MYRSKLKINDDKTEFVVIGLRQQLLKIHHCSVRVGTIDIKHVKVARNLGALFESHFSISTHHRTKNQVSGNLNMVETRDSVAETQRQRVFPLADALRFLMFPSLRFQRNRNTFLHVSDRFPFQESRISAIVNVCLCCGNAIFRTGNLLFRSFNWRKREDKVRQPDLFFRVSVCFRYCVNTYTSKKFHICGNQVFQLEFFLILTWN